MVIHPMPRESKRFGNLPSLDHGTIDGRDETNDAGEEIGSLPLSVVILEFAHSHWQVDYQQIGILSNQYHPREATEISSLQALLTCTCNSLVHVSETCSLHVSPNSGRFFC